MGFAKRKLMEQQERRTCIECNSYVEKRENGWYCPKCKKFFTNACEECTNVFNPQDEGDFICQECLARALERLD